MRVKVMQWNVWYKEDPKKIATVINDYTPDIVGAQELMQVRDKDKVKNTAEEVAAMTKYQVCYVAGDTWDNRDDGKVSQGNAVLSRWPLTKERYQHLQRPKHNPPNAWSEGRVYVEAEVKLPDNMRLTLGTTHLSYYDRFEMTEERKKEVDQLVEVVKKAPKHYVLTGDLNSVADDYAVKQVGRYLTHAGPNYQEPTWTTKPFFYQGFEENKLAWRLDYVFVSSDVVVNKAEIIKTDVSDHLPILVEVEI